VEFRARAFLRESTPTNERGTRNELTSARRCGYYRG
jgi:hypothetical protein